MRQTCAILAIFTIAVYCSDIAHGQTNRTRTSSRAVSTAKCPMAGAFRIDVEASDRLYSVVRGATSSVPFGDQQRFFMDLSVRLTPPDILAIECTGRSVSVGSSRAPRVTFVADGRLRRETTSGGGTVFSRVALDRDTLTFTSTGRAADNVNVVFRSVDGGRRLHVTRRIHADQLSQPIVIQTYYDKIANNVNWDSYADAMIARPPRPDDCSVGATGPPHVGSGTVGMSEAQVLRRSLDDWIEATNDRDIEKQMQYYMPHLQAFYLSRNAPRGVVRAEKLRAFQTARSIDISAEEPEIIFQDGGRTAIMRFRKKYRIVDRARTRSGEVVQELRWQRTGNGWRIFSERDVRVIR